MEVFAECKAVVAGAEIDVEAGRGNALEVQFFGSCRAADGQLDDGGDVLQGSGFSIGEVEAACGSQIAGGENVLSGGERDVAVSSCFCGQQCECIITSTEVHQQVSIGPDGL